MTQTTTILGRPDATLPLAGTERVPMDQAGAVVTAGLFVSGQAYRIVSIGSTNFVTIGAAANTVGLYFTATGIGSGNGTAATMTTVDASTQDIASLVAIGTAGLLDVAATGNASATQVVKGNDTRLTDSRAPTTHTQAASTISDSTTAGRALLTAADAAAQRTSLGLGTAATTAATDYATAAQGTDSREWSAATIDQAEAEAGTATTRRAFTAQRVFQAVAAWWAASAAASKLAGIATGATANSSDATLLARGNHTGTQAFSTITGAPCEIGVACSDETTALTTGTGKVTFRMPYAMTLTAVRLNVNTAVTVAALQVDLKESGTTVFSTQPQVAVGAKTSVGGAVPGVINDSSLASDAEITIDIVQAGGAAKGLKVWLIGTRA